MVELSLPAGAHVTAAWVPFWDSVDFPGTFILGTMISEVLVGVILERWFWAVPADQSLGESGTLEVAD